MSKFFITLLACACSGASFAQDSVVTGEQALTPVTINAFGRQQTILQAPASINHISSRQLDAYNYTGVLEAINTSPGIRMEERSPGSYRINIRGSSLRSPFGVRNVKVYYNDIPVTDPGGFTYFNQFGYFNISSIDVIKGPGSSMYGAGTGGVLLLGSNGDTTTGASLLYEGGSYGLTNIAAELRYAKAGNTSVIRYQHCSSNSYRQQSASTRDVFSWDNTTHATGRLSFDMHLLYNALNYQTPGALTLKEYDSAQFMARPHTAAAMGAIENDAHIEQQNLLLGFSSQYKLSSQLSNRTTVYGNYTFLLNPTIRNYTRSNEPHFGMRTTFNWNRDIGRSLLTIIAGGEGQSGYAMIRTYTNILGRPDTLQSDDEVHNLQNTGFVQLTLKTGRWLTEAGISINAYSTDITRLKDYSRLSRDFPVQHSPRVAASFKVNNDLYTYASIASGFSPPSSAEILPSGSPLNTALNAETGWNYELGAKGTLLNGHLYYNTSIFYYTLENAIVLRKDANGADNYINAGRTSQPGLEIAATYEHTPSASPVHLSLVWFSYSRYNFRYGSFTQLTTDLSGNRLPGVSPNTITAGTALSLFNKVALNVSWFYSDRIALNDANTAYAKAYHIIDAKVSYPWIIHHLSATVFAGVNNALSQKYSLGNDINAAGGRYYNAAPPANYYAGILLAVK